MVFKKELSILILTLVLYLVAAAPNVLEEENNARFKIGDNVAPGVGTETEINADDHYGLRFKRSRRRYYGDYHLRDEVDQLREDLAALRSKFRHSDSAVHVHVHDGGEARQEEHHDDQSDNQGRHDDDHSDDHGSNDGNRGDDDGRHIHIHMHLDGREEHETIEHAFAHCEMIDINPESHGEEHVHGSINFEQYSHDGPVEVNVNLEGFEHHEGDHSFELHVDGDLSNHCNNLGAEYDDPTVDHSRDHSKTGDFGDIHSDSHGVARHAFNNSRVTLIGSHSVIGRSLAVHHSDHAHHTDTDIIGCCVVGRASAAHHDDHHEDSHDTDHHEPVHHYAHCEMQDIDPESHGEEHVHGRIEFEQTDHGAVHVEVRLSGFEHHTGDHAFEIHNQGDLSDHCGNLGNPSDHGDLGDLHTDEHGVGTSIFNTTEFSLTGDHSVIGQSVAIHHSAHGQADSTDIIGCCVIGADNEPHDDHHNDEEHYFGHCEMIDIDPEHGVEHVHGRVNFEQQGNDPVQVAVDLSGFEHHAGDHAFEVHANGDISDHCQNVGAPYDDKAEDHTKDPSATGHFDDLHTDDHGVARHNFTHSRISLHGHHSIIGKSLAVHHSTDGSDTTDIIGCCVVGKATAAH